MKKWILIFIGALILIVGIVYIIGLSMPVAHSVSSTAEINAPVDSIWNRITTFKDYPEWRKNITTVEATSEDEWIETDEHDDKVPYKLSILEDKRKIKTELTGNNGFYNGYWIIEISSSASNSTTIKIIENGNVYNAFFRVMANPTSTINTYLKYLGESFQ
jgi:hypothetical protein